MTLIQSSKGLQLTRRLAELHCQRAVEAIQVLPASPSRIALIAITSSILQRRK
jgi:hexaprenyl-diphosphate synthase